MKFYLWFAALLLVVVGTNSQDFDLAGALDDDDPTPAPSVPEKPKENNDEFDLSDALGPEPKPKPNPDGPVPPQTGGDEFDLSDALGPGKEEPKPKPNPDGPVPPQTGGGGGSFDDSDLLDVGQGGYKPDEGGAGAKEPNYHGDGGGANDDGTNKEAGAGQIAGIASAVGMAILGAASSYFAYQKKKLCFKLQGGADPESGKNYQGGNNTQPQLLSNLLKTS